MADAYDPLFCYSLPFSQAFEFFTKTFRTRTQAESVAYFEGVDAAFAPVQTQRETVDGPRVRARDMVVEGDRDWEHIGLPIKFHDEPGRPDFALPGVGQHTAEVLCEKGYDETEIAAFRDAGLF